MIVGFMAIYNALAFITVCDELREGMMVIMCGDGARAHEAYLGVAENLEVPLINWDLAPIIPADGSFNKYEYDRKSILSFCRIHILWN